MKKEGKIFIIYSIGSIYKKISKLNLYILTMSKMSNIKLNYDRIKKELLELKNDINNLLEKF